MLDARPIDQIAADWVAREGRGLGAGERAELRSWLEADPRHALSYRELQQTWRLLGRLQEAAEPQPVRRPTWLAWSLPLAAAAAIALVLAIHRSVPAPSAPETVLRGEAPPERMRTLELADGSFVHLHADSAIAVRYEPAVRAVTLQRGEAHFAVAKNPARPFTVEAGGVTVRAVGTAFDVRYSSAAVTVVVTEGRVRITPSAAGAAPVFASAGQRAVVSLLPAGPAPAVAAMASTDSERELAWESPRLDFDGTPLGAVVAEFNRYNTHQLVIADAALARRPFGGSFRADGYEGFVRLLESRFGVVAEREGGRTVLRAR